jgi:hypothetical protein
MPSRAGWVTDLLSLPEDLSPPEEAEGRRAVTVVHLWIARFGIWGGFVLTEMYLA